MQTAWTPGVTSDSVLLKNPLVSAHFESNLRWLINFEDPRKHKNKSRNRGATKAGQHEITVRLGPYVGYPSYIVRRTATEEPPGRASIDHTYTRREFGIAPSCATTRGGRALRGGGARLVPRPSSPCRTCFEGNQVGAFLVVDILFCCWRRRGKWETLGLIFGAIWIPRRW